VRVFSQLPFLSLLVIGLWGCDSKEPSALEHRVPTINGQAPYGVIAQIHYDGDRSQLNQDTQIFVFLKKVGVRMPLAIRHFKATELPKTVSFMSSAPQTDVELITRLSFTGQVEKSSNDLEIRQFLPKIDHPPSNLQIHLAEVVAAPAVNPTPVVVKARVSVDPGYHFESDAEVFVVARETGRAMPLAVKRLSINDLPTEITLTDADAMMLSGSLSAVEQFTVTARVDIDRSTSPSAGDWASDVVTIYTGEIPDQVTLDIVGPG
jgi:hypothetical protein